MKSSLKRYPFAFFIVFLLATSPVLYAQEGRDFPQLQGLITDSTGTLSQDDIDRIRMALEQSHAANTLDGHVYIALSTDEWYLDEYVKDYADYLQSRGQISPTGWLLYISIADHKFSLAVQDLAMDSIPQNRKQEIYLVLDEKLRQNDVSGAILDATNRIGNLPTPDAAHEKSKVSPGLLIFMGIATMIAVMMLRLRKARRKTANT